MKYHPSIVSVLFQSIGGSTLNPKTMKFDPNRFLFKPLAARKIEAFEKELAESSRPAAFVEKAVPLSKK